MPRRSTNTQARRRWRIVLPTVVALIAAMAALLFAPIVEHHRVQSPDGVFTAVVRTQPFRALIGAMPGQGSDKPGRVTVYRGSQSCGSVWLPMVSFLYDLRWETEQRPRRAEIRLTATWNLDTCARESVFDG
jgi:hypothetical protein